MTTAIVKSHVDGEIRDLMNLLVDAINYEDLANRIVRLFAAALHAELCTLWRRVGDDGDDKLVLSASVGFDRKPGEKIPDYVLKWSAKSNEEIEGVTAWIAVRNRSCLCNSYKDLAENPASPWFGSHRGKWDNLQFMAGDEKRSFRSLLGLPVVYGKDETVIGVLKAENSNRPDGFDDQDFKLAQELMPFVGIALQTMFKREQHEQNRQRVLKDLTSALPVLALLTFHQQVVDKTAELLNADICSLWLVNEERTKLVLGANYGIRKKTDVPEYRLNWDAKKDAEIEGLTPWVAITKKSFFAGKFEDLKSHPAHRGKWDTNQWQGHPAEQFGVLYAVPLLREDKTIGVLKIENSRGKHIFNDVDKATFDVMAEFISLAIELSTRLRSNIVFDFFHLLKQPTLSAINAFSSMRQELARKPQRSDRIKERLEMVAVGLDSVRVWTMNVYGLASAPSRQTIEEVPAKTNFHRIFTTIIKEMRKLFPAFKCRLSPDLREVQIELTKLELKKVEVICFNILNNSYKYSGHARPRKIVASVKKKRGATVISVGDNGQGIAPEILPRIFDPFFTTSATKWPESLGMGLSTVKNLLHGLGWTCDVQSTPGEGTCFSIIIPQVKKRRK